MGQKKNNRPDNAPGGRKASAEEIERRVEWCAELVGVRQKTKTEVHDAFRRRYKLCCNLVDKLYIPRAKKLIMARTRMTAGQARDLGVAVLLDAIRVGKTTERILAVRKLAEIFGFDAPRRHELAGPGGGPIETLDVGALARLTSRKLEQIVIEAEQEMELAGNGEEVKLLAEDNGGK